MKYRFHNHAALRIGRGLLLAVVLFPMTGIMPRSAVPPDVKAEFNRRLKQVSDDSTACISLGQWGMKRGLEEDVFGLYRRFLAQHGHDEAVYESILKVADERRLPDESKPLQDARSNLGRRFLEYRSDHFILLSDADPSWSRTQLAALEATHHEFMRFCRLAGLKPLPLEHRLVCVLFRELSDYQAFASTHDGVRDPHIAGYFSPRTNRTVFYHPDQNPSLETAVGAIRELETDMKRLEAALRDARRANDHERIETLRHAVQTYRDQHRTENDRILQFIDRVATATTVHEATHHLLFHTHVQSPFVQYPLWISEGLATTFETERPDHAFGPEFDSGTRREEFQRLVREGTLIPLETLVQLTSLPSRGDTTATVVYHESYALIAWLYRYRRDDLASYLHLMRAYPPGRPSPREHLAIFEDAFGDVDELERAWLRAEGATKLASKQDKQDRVSVTPAAPDTRDVIPME